MLDMLKQFLADERAWDMYVTGQAGTGKTTGLAKAIEYCHMTGTPYVVCAFTHKACNILRSKLPDGARVQTLDSYIKRRPSINQEATKEAQVETNVIMGGAEHQAVLFVDEYSMVGDTTLTAIRELQEDLEADNGIPKMKVVWLGDPNQLPPVGDTPAVYPGGEYNLKLTKVYRQADDNPLMDTLQKLVAYIEGREKPQPLEPHASLIRGVDLVETYKQLDDAVMLAFTNERVQELNAEVQGYDEPRQGDILFSPTTKHFYTFVEPLDITQVPSLDRPFGSPLERMKDKYRTLDTLMELDLRCAVVYDHELEEDCILAYEFGHGNWSRMMQQFKKEAAGANKAIVDKYNMQAAAWAAQNRDSSLAKRRARAWRHFLAVNKNAVCLDFAHAMTVHKSQGSTFKYVVADTDNIAISAKFGIEQYLRLLYVTMSRASDRVYTN